MARMRALRAIGIDTSNISLSLGLFIYKTFVRPDLLYVVVTQSLNKKQTTSVRVVYSQANCGHQQILPKHAAHIRVLAHDKSLLNELKQNLFSKTTHKIQKHSNTHRIFTHLTILYPNYLILNNFIHTI